MGLFLAFLAAWWLRGVLAVIALFLAWYFLVPAGFLGKQAAVAEAPGQPPVATPMLRVVIPPATAVPSAPRAAASVPDSAGPCHAFHDYGLKFKPEVSTSGTYVRVQYWSPALPPGERETFMSAAEAVEARFLVTRPDLDGHVWEFKGACDDALMLADAKTSTERRIAAGADNRGYVPWRDTGLFQPAVPR